MGKSYKLEDCQVQINGQEVSVTELEGKVIVPISLLEKCITALETHRDSRLDFLRGTLRNIVEEGKKQHKSSSDATDQ